jgi:hypothetical protein
VKTNDDKSKCDEIVPVLNTFDKKYDKRVAKRKVKYGDLIALRKAFKVSIICSAKAEPIIPSLYGFRQAE